MNKRFFLLFITFMVLFLSPLSYVLARDTILSGDLSFSVESKNKTKKYNNITFYSNSNWVKLIISSKVYYIINIASEKAFIINTKRKTISETVVKNIIDFDSPSLKIFQNKDILKKFLSNNSAKFITSYKLNQISYEQWSFTVKGNSYLISIKLPEFLICKLQVKMPKKSIYASVKNLKSTQLLENSFFSIPQKFTIIKLDTK